MRSDDSWDNKAESTSYRAINYYQRSGLNIESLSAALRDSIKDS